MLFLRSERLKTLKLLGSLQQYYDPLLATVRQPVLFIALCYPLVANTETTLL